MTFPVSIAQAQQADFPGSGTAVISDGTGLSSRITYTMTGMRRLGPEQAYEGWLVNSGSGTMLSTGVMRPTIQGEINHTFNSPTGENLIANYNQVVISVEPVPDPAPAEPSDMKPFSHTIPGGAMTNIRNLVVSWPEGDPTGIAMDMKAQLDVAIQHANLAANATTIEDVMLHTHHVINIIEGEGGPNFDSSFGNPGDGVGVLTYAQDASQQASAAAASGDPVVSMHAENVQQASQNVMTWSTQARDQALQILNRTSINIAQTLLAQVSGPLQAARNGISATNMGGAQQAYTQAQMMATYTFPSPQATAPGVGDAAVPVVAQMAIGSALLLMAFGGFLLYRERRSREISV
jgi:hypothetical protein